MLYFAKWKIAVILGLCLLGVAYAAPNLLSPQTAERLPTWLPHKQVALGLDLQGGSHLLYEVEVAAVVRERVVALENTARTALRGGNIGYTNLGTEGGAVAFTLRDPAQADEVRRRIREADSSLDIEVREGGRVYLTFRENELRQLRQSAVQQAIEIIGRRVNETGVREPTIQRQGEDRIIVQLPGVGDPEQIKALIGTTAKLTFHLLDTTASAAEARDGRAPPGSVVLPGEGRTPGTTQDYLVRRTVVVGGERLVDAQPGFQNGAPIVRFRFDTVGARMFGRATQENVGRPLGIVLDNRVISAPVIREPILGGEGIISGNFTTQEAQNLALLLRAGALPAPLRVLEERTVGPSLGADSIAAGKAASIVGMILVVMFMVVAYSFFGLIANVALVLNLVILVAVLSVLGATLTLPGIAGVVLTMGMAVDANVLIFERMREEMRQGRTLISAIEVGYQRALTTIVDSNVTTLIAGVILYFFGSGPIRGFAVTLSIGILTSMFTAVWVTRLMVVTWLRQKRRQELPI